MFAGWAEGLPTCVDVRSIELPGRGSRFCEQPLTDMPSLVAQLEKIVEDFLDIPFFLFGHSMGAVAALELGRRLVAGGRGPVGLIVSGCAPPHLPLRRGHMLHALPTDKLIAELVRLDGLPAAVAERADFIDTFLPTIRADLRCRETWRSERFDIGVPIHVMAGVDDALVRASDLLAWSVFTSAIRSISTFDGGHFFIRSQERAVLDHLAAIVSRCSAASAA